MIASEVYSSEVKKTAVLSEVMRRSIGISIKEHKEVFEGEITQLMPEETANPLGSFGKSISHVIVGLKTTKGTQTIRLDSSIYSSLLKQKCSVGDVVYIEASSGTVKVNHFSYF